MDPMLRQLPLVLQLYTLPRAWLKRVDAALLLGYTIHFIYCIWGNLRQCRYTVSAPAWQSLTGHVPRGLSPATLSS